MDKLQINLEHCYGIKKLNAEFYFAEYGPVFTVYAPNGVMKTSLANTFRDMANAEETTDRIYPENSTVREIQDGNGNQIQPDNLFVIEPYNEKYRSEKISTLLVNDELRTLYENIYKEIDDKAEALVKQLKGPTGLKKEIREEFSDSITHDTKEFYIALGRVRDEVEQGEDSALGDIVYSHIFNPKTESILADPEFRERIKDYIEKYDDLVSHSTFFRKGVFTHNNAADIAKNLKSNGFFRAEHSVVVSIGGEKQEIKTENELEAAIRSEKDRILTDEGLKSAFEKIDKQLNKNADMKQFRVCLENNQIAIPELDNPERLRQKLWVSYLIRTKEQYQDLMATYNSGKEEIAKIIEKAKEESTKWAEVISIFNDRFFVPFVVRIDNQDDVILRRNAPVIRFDFLEDPGNIDSATVPVEEERLLQVLSNGEKRALYILNIIFEVEARKTANQETLFVIDDIADSFDYKNKYAIIEYLKDLSEEEIFIQIVLSHNFDFHRTVSGRLNLPRESRLLTGKKENGEIYLEQEIYQNSAPFSHWRDHFDNDEMLVASIPFLRNLVEFAGDKNTFNRLTSLLHFKPDTQLFKIQELNIIITQVLHDKDNISLDNPDNHVIELIYQVADTIADDANETASLEKKICLSIAIRLKAEGFLVAQINDQDFWEGITKNQSITLIKRYKTDFPDEKENIRLIEQVNLMTPENIHLNSFMYEPILDLSAQHLKKLYNRIKALQ